MFDFFQRKSKAVIVLADLATDKVEVSEEIATVQQANAIQAQVISTSNGISLERTDNDYDGHRTTALIPQDEQQTVYHKTIFETFPTDAL